MNAVPCPAPVETRDRSIEIRDGWYCRACNHNHGDVGPMSICGASVTDDKNIVDVSKQSSKERIHRLQRRRKKE